MKYQKAKKAKKIFDGLINVYRKHPFLKGIIKNSLYCVADHLVYTDRIEGIAPAMEDNLHEPLPIRDILYGSDNRHITFVLEIEDGEYYYSYKDIEFIGVSEQILTNGIEIMKKPESRPFKFNSKHIYNFG